MRKLDLLALCPLLHFLRTYAEEMLVHATGHTHHKLHITTHSLSDTSPQITVAPMSPSHPLTPSPPALAQMLVDDIGDVTITNDGATILKQLEVEHPAAKVSWQRGMAYPQANAAREPLQASSAWSLGPVASCPAAHHYAT